MRKLALMAGVFVLALTTPAAAVTLIAGDNPLPGTTAALRPELAGTVIEDVLVPYSLSVGTGTLSGSVQQRVVREDGSGTLDFYWRILPEAGGTLPVLEFRLGDFGPFVTDADWRSDGSGSVAPSSAFSFGMPGFVTFRFADTAVGPATTDSSRFFFLHTNATRYASTAEYDLVCGPIGCTTDPFSTFAPLASIPEPTGWGMMIAGFFGAGVLLRRRPRALAV